MSNKFLIIAIITFSATTSYSADEQTSIDVTLKALASDLAKLQEKIDQANKIGTEEPSFAVAVQATDNSLYSTCTCAPINDVDGWGAFVNCQEGTTCSVENISKYPLDLYPATYDLLNFNESLRVVNSYNGLSSMGIPGSATINVSTVNASNMDMIYEKILESVMEVKNKYKNNPHVSVSGFSIEVSLPPSVNLSFEFKD